jgi:protein-arginine kinase
MKNYANGSEIPIGLGMALAQNLEAMNYFSSLNNEQKQNVIEQTHSIGSKEEMQQFVSAIAERNSIT